MHTEAIRACREAACRWKLTTEEFSQLVGSEITTEEDLDLSTSSHVEALKEQCYLLLEIDKCLHVLFPDEAANGWVKRNNRAYGGKTALQHMLAGGEAAKHEVLSYLKAVIYT